MNKSKDSAYLKLHSAVFLAGGTGIFGRMITLNEMPLVWYRMLIGLIAFTIFLAYYKKIHIYRGMTLVRLGVLGTMLAVHWFSFYAAIKASNVSIAVVCIALEGFFTAIFDPIISRRRVRISELLLSMIAFFGIVLIFGFDARYRVGIAWGVLCSAIYAVFAICSKRVQQAENIPSSNLLLYELGSGWLFITCIMPLYATANPSLTLIPDMRDALLLLVFGTVFTIGPFLLQLQALRAISAFTVNLTYNLESVYSIVFAMILFNEGNELNRYFWIGILMIILSVVLQTIYSKQENNHKLTKSST